MTTNVAAPFATRRRFTTRRPHADNTATIRKWHLFGRKRHKKTLCATRVTNTASITRNTPCVSFTQKNTKWQRTSPMWACTTCFLSNLPPHRQNHAGTTVVVQNATTHSNSNQTRYCLDRDANHAKDQDNLFRVHLSVVRVSSGVIWVSPGWPRCHPVHLGVIQVPSGAI